LLSTFSPTARSSPQALQSNQDAWVFALARYNSDGELDSSFDTERLLDAASAQDKLAEV
jgi:hypothetical protein